MEGKRLARTTMVLKFLDHEALVLVIVMELGVSCCRRLDPNRYPSGRLFGQRDAHNTCRPLRTRSCLQHTFALCVSTCNALSAYSRFCDFLQANSMILACGWKTIVRSDFSSSCHRSVVACIYVERHRQIARNTALCSQSHSNILGRLAEHKQSTHSAR